MNEHYLELKLFFQELEMNLEIAEYVVFKSKPRLYGSDKKVNHQLHRQYKHIEQKVFGISDKTTVHSCLLQEYLQCMRSYQHTHNAVTGADVRF